MLIHKIYDDILVTVPTRTTWYLVVVEKHPNNGYAKSARGSWNLHTVG